MVTLKKVDKIAQTLYVAVVTLAIVWNFYPQPGLPTYSFWIALIAVAVVNVFTNRKRKATDQENTFVAFYFGSYLLLLNAFLWIFRGEPSTGYVFYDPLIWIAFIPVVYMDWKKFKRSRNLFSGNGMGE